jgi:integrase
VSEYTLTRHRGKLALTWREPGRLHPRRISTGTADERRAETIAREIWARLHAAQSERVADLWPAYVRDRVVDGAMEDRFRVTWNALGPHFGHIIGSKVTREDCRAYHRYRRGQGRSASTIATELALLRACLKWRYGATAPSVWVPPASAPRDHWLTKEQVRHLLEATDTPHIRLFITLAASTGARAQAILELTWDRVDMERGEINYRPAGREITNKRRTIVPMNTNARTALEEAYRARLSDHVVEYGGKPVASVKKALQRLSAKTGIKVSPHVLRHSCAVWMAQADVPMAKIAQYLGHTKTAVTEMYYARFSPSYMQDASAAAEF